MAASEKVEIVELGNSTEIISTKEKYEMFVQTINKWYGEERVDIRVDNQNRGIPSELTVIVWFPEVEITNSKGLKHKILDLYIRFTVKLNSDGIKIENLGGTRGTITEAEFDSNYVHSHIASLNYNEPYSNHFTHCCFGTGPMHEILSLLYQTTSKEQLQYLIESFLMNLDVFVSWESLEGSPYKSIINVKKQTGNRLTNLFSDTIQIVVDAYFQRFGKEIPMTVHTSALGKIQVELSRGKVFFAQMNSIIDSFSYRNLKVTCVVQSDGNLRFYSVSENANREAHTSFQFKGRTHKTKVLTNEKFESKKLSGIYPHPELTEAVDHRIRSRFEKFLKRQTSNYLVGEVLRKTKSKYVDLSLCTDFVPAQEVSGS